MSGRFTVETVFKGTDNTSGVISSIQARTKGLQSAMSGPVGLADKGIDGFKKVGAVAAVAGVAAGAAFHHMVETGADFEQSITNVGAVMGKSRTQIADLEQAALKLGVSTQFSSSEVSEAMEMMARKGFDSQEILAGIPGVLDAIAASGQGMAEVATVVGSSIRGFGLEAKEANKVANLLAFTAEKTGATITDMGTALAIAAPTARALGVSIEDTAAGVGLLQRMGIDASTAGTATATMLAKISHPSKEAAEKMAAMGIQFKDAKGNMLAFRDVLGQFVKAGDKAGGNMDKMSFFAELVGLRGDKAALALSDMAKSGDFDKLVAGIKNTGDYAHKVATIRMDTTTGSWKLLTSTVEVLETKLFGLNNGGLKTAIDRVNAWVSANQGLIVSGATEYADKLVTGVIDLTKNIDKGVQTLGWFKDGLNKAFEHSASVAVFGSVLEKVFGGKDGEGFGKKAYDLGHGIGYAVDKIILFTGVVKGAEATVWLFGNAMKVVKGIQVAYAVVTGGITTVQTLYNLATGAGSGATLIFGGAMTEASLAAGELAIAEEAAMAGAGELAIAEEAAAAGAVELGTAAVAAEAGIGGIGVAAGIALAPIAAATAAFAALVAAAYELYQLYKESGGADGMFAGIKGFAGVGTKSWGLNGYNEGVDETMNRKARAERDSADAATDAPMRDPTGYRFGPAGSWDPANAYGAGTAPPSRPPGPYADGYVAPAPSPQVVPMRDMGDQAKTNQLNDTMRQIVPQLKGAMQGVIKIELIDKGKNGKVTASGGPGISMPNSGADN